MKWILAFFFTWPLFSAEIVTATVGLVKDHVVTSREVEINRYIEASLRKSEPIPEIPTMEKASFQTQVDATLLEWVVYLEAGVFGNSEVAEKEMAEALARVRDRLPQKKRWRELKVLQTEIKKQLRRKLLAKKFIKFKAESSVVPVTDSEVQKYYEENTSKFGQASFDLIKGNIREFLSKKSMDQRLQNWFEVLQTKYRVRNFLAET